MRYSLTRSSVFHPFLFAVMPVLLFVSLNLNKIILDYIFSILLIIVAAVIVSWYLLNLLLRDKMKSGLMLSLGLVLFFSYGHIYNILLFSLNISTGVNRYILPLFLIVFVAGIFAITKTKKHHKEFTVIANGIALVIISISIFNIGAYALQDNNFEIHNNLTSYNTHMLDYTPNVYYIILDAYANSKVLERAYGFDNSKFLSELSTRGFHVSRNSHSNYQSTPTSLPSSLNMEYITSLAEESGATLNPRLLNTLWNNNKVINIFKSYNYTTITMPLYSVPPKISDHELCQNLFLFNEEDIVFWETTLLNPVFKVFNIDQHQRDKILCKFEELSNLHNSVNEPFFAYVHFLLPHSPFLFGPNGEPIQSESLAPGAAVSQDYKSKYLAQLKFTNKKVIDAIDKILQGNTTPPIIILQSDHGPDHFQLAEIQRQDRDGKFNEVIRDRMSILNAYYLPDQNPNLIYEHITPVNSFRLIFNTYFNENFDLLEDKSYFQYDGRYNFTDVTYILTACEDEC